MYVMCIKALGNSNTNVSEELKKTPSVKGLMFLSLATSFTRMTALGKTSAIALYNLVTLNPLFIESVGGKLPPLE